MSFQPTLVNYCSFVLILEADSSTRDQLDRSARALMPIIPLRQEHGDLHPQMEGGQSGAFIVKEAEVKPIQQKQFGQASQETSQLTLTLAGHWKQVTLKALNSLSEVLQDKPCLSFIPNL